MRLFCATKHAEGHKGLLWMEGREGGRGDRGGDVVTFNRAQSASRAEDDAHGDDDDDLWFSGHLYAQV